MELRDITLCFSGHRTYAGNDEESLRLKSALTDAYDDGYRRFLCGMAQGFDLAAAEAVLQMREKRSDARLIAAVPFRGQEEGFSETDKKRYHAILAEADSIVTLADEYHHGCYFARNDFMVNQSSRIICYYDGTGGGTRHTVKQAIRGGLRIVNVYKAPDSLF